jgi:hypothetical protein
MIGLDVRDMVEKLNGGLIDSAEILYKEVSALKLKNHQSSSCEIEFVIRYFVCTST